MTDTVLQNDTVPQKDTVLRDDKVLENNIVLEVSGLHAGYGQIEVLRGISLSLAAGELATIIGANGAGKTTLLRCLSGLCRIRTGSARFKDTNLCDTPAHQLPSKGLVMVPEGRRIFPRLSVMENLDLGGYSTHEGKPSSEDYARAFELFPILAERKNQAGGTLSGGEQQMLAIVRALMARPQLLLLDEPSMGVAPKFVERIMTVIQRLNAEGMTILLVEQNAHLALEIAKNGYVLETGSISLQGPAALLKVDPRVREAYLGE